MTVIAVLTCCCIIASTSTSNIRLTVDGMQSCVAAIHQWCDSRSLQLNPTKTQAHGERRVAGASAPGPGGPKGAQRAPQKNLSWECLLLGVIPPRTSLRQGPKGDGVITYYFFWYHLNHHPDSDRAFNKMTVTITPFFKLSVPKMALL